MPQSKASLPDHCPLAFEVIYQYLYTGKVHKKASHYGYEEDDDHDEDEFWLRVFRLALHLEMPEAQKTVYSIFIDELFAFEDWFMPSDGFLKELISTLKESMLVEESNTGIQQLYWFIVAQTAYSFLKDHEFGWPTEHWEPLFTSHPSFALHVLKRLSKVKGSHDKRNPEPGRLPRFRIYSFSSMPKEQQEATIAEVKKHDEEVKKQEEAAKKQDEEDVTLS